MSSHIKQFMKLPRRERSRRLRLAHRVLTQRSETITYTDWGDRGRSKTQIIRSRAWYEYQTNRMPRELYDLYARSLMRDNYLSNVQRTRMLVQAEPDNDSLRKYARCIIRRKNNQRIRSNSA